MRFEELLAYYRDDCAPAIDELERFFEDGVKGPSTLEGQSEAANLERDGILYRYPEIHNEIRMAFSHLSRAVLSGDASNMERFLVNNIDTSPTEFDDALHKFAGIPFSRTEDEAELDQAKKHLKRATMDARKGLYLEKLDSIATYLDDYEAYSVEELEDGDFFRLVEGGKVEAAKSFEKGKIAENLGEHDEAEKQYCEANTLLDQVREVIDRNKLGLATAKHDYFAAVKTLLPDFALVILSIVAALVLFCFGGE